MTLTTLRISSSGRSSAFEPFHPDQRWLNFKRAHPILEKGRLSNGGTRAPAPRVHISSSTRTPLLSSPTPPPSFFTKDENFMCVHRSRAPCDEDYYPTYCVRQFLFYLSLSLSDGNATVIRVFKMILDRSVYTLFFFSYHQVVAT